MTEIKIKDLRGVGDVELNLDDTKRVFVFFGSNGVGKTKTLEAFYYFFLAQTNNFSATNYAIKLSKILIAHASNSVCFFMPFSSQLTIK